MGAEDPSTLSALRVASKIGEKASQCETFTMNKQVGMGQAGARYSL